MIAPPFAQGRALACMSQGEKNFAPGLAADAYENLGRILKGDPDWKPATPLTRDCQTMN